jgi:hypothetical protein
MSRKGLYLHTTDQHRKKRTNIHALNGIRTHNISVQAVEAYAWDSAATGTDHVSTYDNFVFWKVSNYYMQVNSFSK